MRIVGRWCKRLSTSCRTLPMRWRKWTGESFPSGRSFRKDRFGSLFPTPDLESHRPTYRKFSNHFLPPKASGEPVLDFISLNKSLKTMAETSRSRRATAAQASSSASLFRLLGAGNPFLDESPRPFFLAVPSRIDLSHSRFVQERAVVSRFR